MPKRLNIEDYIGKKYNKLTIIALATPYIDPKTKGKRKVVLTKCECGNFKEINLSNILSNETKSCGCYKKQLKLIRNKSHGLSRTREYKIYYNIKTRCYDITCKAYKNYGGRGITMSNEWLNSFEQFYADMGKRPSTNHSIERLKVNEGYCRENCCWATRHTQSSNTRNSNKNVGVYYNKNTKNWTARLEVDKKFVLRKTFKTEKEAIAARKAAEIKYNIYN